jgi:hypothetical protein
MLLNAARALVDTFDNLIKMVEGCFLHPEIVSTSAIIEAFWIPTEKYLQD